MYLSLHLRLGRVYVKTSRIALSKPLLSSRLLYRRLSGFVEYSSSFSGTHNRNLSHDEAQILRYLSDHRLRDARDLLDKLPERENQSPVVCWTSLLTKYTKSGFVDEAEILFDIIPDRNTVTYNAMLTGYVKSGRLSDACQLFYEMPKNVVSWTIMVCGLCDAGRTDDARKLFDEMPERNTVSWNSLVAGLVRNGDLKGARRIFDDMPDRNVISWNAMISGYVENCQMEEARALFEKMNERNVVTWTSMISGYCRIGNVHEGYNMFLKMQERNIVTWTAMIGGLAWNGFYEYAFLLFLKMKKFCDIRLNGETFVSLVYASAGVGFHLLGKQVHAQVIVNCWGCVDYDRRLLKSLIHMYTSFGLMGFAQSLFKNIGDSSDIQPYNHMISGYVKVGLLEAARNLFEAVKYVQDTVTWTAMIDGFLNAGEISQAYNLFNEMSYKDSITWTVMISGLVHNELFSESINLFREMLACGFQPLNSTYSVLLGASGATASLDLGKQLHCMISKTSFVFDLLLENSLVSMYAKCGVIDDAEKIFSKMVIKDLISWNSMIMGFSHHGLSEEALRAFKKMVNSGTKPNSVTFLGVLSACSHSGLLQQGFKLFNSMKNVYSIQPESEHYICIIDLLGRAGKLKEAEEFVSKLPFTPDQTIFGALLGACGMSGKDVDMAERAIERLLEFDPLNAPAHVALCNVYARNHKRSDEHKLRKEMGLKGVRKIPGCSWVKLNGRTRVFLSGDRLNSLGAQTLLPLLCGVIEDER